MILKKEYSNEFIYYSLLNLRKDINKFIETGTQGNLNAALVKSFDVAIPIKKEQQKIASFLSLVDKKIDLAKQQIEKTQTFKKGLLQQMFI